MTTAIMIRNVLAIYIPFSEKFDRPCALVVSVPDYRSRGPSSIPGATILFLRSSWSGTGYTQPRNDN
jgi:hypothetical protein